MPKLIRADYGQPFLLPPSIEDWVGADHPARLVREVVESLDLAAEGFVIPDSTDANGRPAYDPALLLSVWIFGYMSRIRTTRRLEEAIGEQMGFIWLERQLPSARLGELTRAGQLRSAVAAALEQVMAGEAKHVHPLEPEAVRVKPRRGGTPFGYNAQAVVDGQAHIITAAEVHAEASDMHLAQPMMERAEANTQGASAEALSLADTGYSCSEAHRLARESGRELLTPLRPQTANPEDKPFHASKFCYDEAADTVHCPGGQDLPYARTRVKEGLSVRIYRSQKACANCPVRSLCTQSPKRNVARTIEIAPGHAAVEALRQRLAQPFQQALLARRCAIVEPVFGWIKAQDGFGRFTLAGLDNVRTQWSLVCAARNLRTLYQTWRQNGCRLAPLTIPA